MNKYCGCGGRDAVVRSPVPHFDDRWSNYARYSDTIQQPRKNRIGEL